MKNFLKKNLIFSFFPLFLLFFLSEGTNSKSNSDLEKHKTMEKVNPDSLLQEQFNRAVGFLRKGEFDYSVQSFENTIITINKGGLSDKILIYRTYVNFGVLLNRVGDWKRALKFYDFAESFTIDEFGDGSQKLAPIYVNKGNIYNNYGDLIKAKNYYEKALSLLKNKNESRWFIQITHNLGIIAYKKNNYLEALNYLKERLNLKNEQKNGNTSPTKNIIGNCIKN